MTTVVQTDAFAGSPHQRPRPNRFDKTLRRTAAEALLPQIEEWIGVSLTGADRERVLDILTSRCGDDGYDIARKFDHEGYSPDAELVEILDDLDTHWAYAEAVRLWLAETGAKPKLAIGAVVAIPARLKEHEGVFGEIVSIDERRGEYTVCCASLGHVRERTGTRGLIFPWEEIEAVPVTL